MSEDAKQMITDFVQDISKDLQRHLKEFRVKTDNNEAEIAKLNKIIDDLKKKSDQELLSLNVLINKGVDELKATLEKSIASNAGSLQNSLSETKAGFKSEIQNALSKSEQRYASLEEKTNSGLKEINQRFTKETEELRSTIENDVKVLHGEIQAEHSEALSKIGEMSTTAENELARVEKSFNDTSASTASRFDNLLERLNSLKEEFSSSLVAMEEKTQESVTKVRSENEQQLQESEKRIAESQDQMDKKFETLVTDLKSTLEVMSENFNKKNKDLTELLVITKRDFTGQISSLQDSWNKNYSMVASEQGNLQQLAKNHSDGLLTFSTVLDELRKGQQKGIEEIKNDQKTLMQSFQRIISGASENVRNEVKMFSKEVQRQLGGFSKENSLNFMAKADGDRVNDRLKTLDLDLRSKTEAIRSELVRSLEDSLKSFEGAMKTSLASVSEMKIELEKYKDEIDFIIERKANERFEYVYEILTGVLSKAEQLSSLFRDSKVSIPKSIEVPVQKLDPKKLA